MFFRTSEYKAAQDRRNSPRYVMTGPVHRLDNAGNSTEVGRVRDISLGGCYVSGDSGLVTNEKVHLKFAIGADFEMNGVVTRSDASGFAVVFEMEEAATGTE